MLSPRIIVLDGHTLNPGDQSWAALEALGDVTVFPRTPPDKVIERALGAEVLLTNKVALDASVIARLPGLRYVGVTATGTNIVDRDAARARGIVVTNVPSYGTDSVAEHTLSLMLESCKHLAEHTRGVRDGAWSRQPDFSVTLAPLGLLAGKTLGIVGLGAIGRRVAELARCFGMHVVAARHGSGGMPGVERLELDALLERSDIVSLHCPLSAATERFIDRERLARMKPGAVLVNTARGALVDEAALAVALATGRLRGAYLDVLWVEPPPPDHPLLSLPNCWITPHVAWASREARQRLLETTVANVRAFLLGSPVNVVT